MRSPLDRQAVARAYERSIQPVALAMIAKAPVAGLAKTRLCPPCSAVQAAALAEASLLDTLDAMAQTGAARHVVVLDGEPSPTLRSAIVGLATTSGGFEVIGQRGADLGERLACAFADIGTAALIVGMDTPQATPELLTQAIGRLAGRETDAVLGEAQDGGYWAIGLKRANARVFDGIAMSTSRTASLQRERLALLGLRTAELLALRDVDVFADATDVAGLAPATRFARTLTPIAEELLRVGV